MSDEQEKRALQVKRRCTPEEMMKSLGPWPSFSKTVEGEWIDPAFLSHWKHLDEAAPIPQFRATFDLRVTPPSRFCFNMDAALEGDRKISEEMYAKYCEGVENGTVKPEGDDGLP